VDASVLKFHPKRYSKHVRQENSKKSAAEVWELLAEIHRGVTIHHLKNRTVSSTGIKSKQEVR
jgi:hypothetical protein